MYRDLEYLELEPLYNGWVAPCFPSFLYVFLSFRVFLFIYSSCSLAAFSLNREKVYHWQVCHFT